MLIVDTHCHALPHWFEPVEVLLHQTANGVDKATLVQVRGQFDERYIMECVQRFPGRFSAVAIVDTDEPEVPATLARWASAGAEGVRLGPTAGSPGNDPLAIWRRAAELGIPVSYVGSAEGSTSPLFEQVVKECPSLPIIIEHLGGIGRDETPPYPTIRKTLALARCPNAYIKVHGLGEISHRPMLFPVPMRFRSTSPVMAMTYDAFGAPRMMWGSDFPPVAGREGYRNVLQWTMEHIPCRSNLQRSSLLWYGSMFGRKGVAHDGQGNGMSVAIAMVPEEQFGVVIHANMHRTWLPQA